MRATRGYSDPAVVAEVSRQLVDSGNTVLQIHRLAESQAEHVYELLKFFDPPANAHVLDVGCGVGGVAAFMAAKRPDLRFTLLNNSAEQLALCPSRFETLCADLHDIPLPDASVDATMICYALGHTELEKALEECARVTRPDGLLFIYDLIGDDSKRLIEVLDFEAYPTERITAAAKQAGYALDEMLIPDRTYVEHFFDKMPGATFEEVFSGINPALFRFRKCRPATRITTVLQFSGGKDSLACLYLLEPHWSEIMVAWVNTGAAFPETIAQMAEIRAKVPHFIEIAGRQSIDREGYPTDVLPIASTTLGQQFERTRPRRFQSRYSCCAAALWIPMQQAMKDLGAKVIIRGQKRVDDRSNRIRSGTVIDGIRYEFPIDDWTDEQVKEYLASRGVELPANYRYMNTGLDCWNCTAYLDQNVGKFDYMRERHPQKHEHVQGVLAELDEIIGRDLEPVRKIRTGNSASPPAPPIAGERCLGFLPRWRRRWVAIAAVVLSS
jgi:3'-phosphoadenosine 5'-phosphosulfate sulfotransferase (PAPS reductase)/FAD synthetase/ubiquinone/menaquinone biosynthesis C-methylase UbiE